MNIRTKAALQTLGFLAGCFAIGGSVVLLGALVGEKIAMMVFAAAVISYMAWVVYEYKVSTLQTEEDYSNK